MDPWGNVPIYNPVCRSLLVRREIQPFPFIGRFFIVSFHLWKQGIILW
ncbi:hypothetical protein GDO81_011336 [Engystomops pustulosus]|uniref:Uncharacterized protein n=1 Tax=Engystomops pustulosus TaxID=76066 RepID=A0AAV7BDW4_ENGPU|nr:hypothetical protein GDO81_011336 [Engystomops pustulosus]